jgi:putative FmdB family regulatory protein
MPTYEYRCRDCGEELEVVQSFQDAALTECPACGGSLRKLFGNVGITFKGSGFYKTDSRAASGAGVGGSKTSSGGDKSSGEGSGNGSSTSSDSAGSSSGGDKAASSSNGSKDSGSSSSAKPAASKSSSD